MVRYAFVFTLVLAACGSPPTTATLDLPGARNEALRAAAERHDLPLDWLVAIGYQQGRFERADAVDDMAPDAEDPAEVLAEDTPLDDVMPPADDGIVGTDIDPPDAWGVMFLGDAQIAEAATLTGNDPDTLRTDVAANIDAAAALIAARWDHTPAGLRTATTAFLGVDDDADTTDLALGDLDDVIRNGFDLTTVDGERLAMIGSDPDVEAFAAPAPGKYPARQWIPSPNFSSRLGYHVRFIVIHDIEGTMAGAISVFKHSSSEASAHYITRARDGHVVQMVHEGDNAWHAGHGWFNRNSIGIEHEGFAFRKHGGGYYTDRQYRASSQLACAIAHRYGIPVNRKHIFGHMNVPSSLSSHTLCSDARGIAGHCGGVSHHADPGRYWSWTKYMSLVRTCVNAAN
jgi:N-acetyl-anhydromuramyl-L-alanine amidase AmpD